MKLIHHRVRRALLPAVLAGLWLCCAPTAWVHAADSLRPELAKPLNDAQTLYRAHRYKDALEKIDQAAVVPNKTPYETEVVEEMRGAAAMAAGDSVTAAKAYESLLSSGQLKGDDAHRIGAALAGIYFQQKNYAQAVKTAQRYFRSGGDDPEMRTLLMQSYYLSGDYSNAIAQLKTDLDAQVRAGRVPDETELQLLGTCAQKANDTATYRTALERLVVYHPKQSYWTDLLDSIRTRSGYLSLLDVDTYRLRRATGSLATADDYMEFTQLAIVAGSTAEGKQVIDQGFTSGVLGKDAQADREKRLQALAEKRAQAGAVDNDAKPVPPFDTGFNLVFQGKVQQGSAMMQTALEKGGSDHPDLERLRLGEAYYFAGDKPRAVQAFKAVKGTDGSADLAQLWLLIAARS